MKHGDGSNARPSRTGSEQDCRSGAKGARLRRAPEYDVEARARCGLMGREEAATKHQRRDADQRDGRIVVEVQDDIAAEVARLEKLGATVFKTLDRWVVMQAPTGQRFCVVRIQRPGFPKNANRWD